MAKDSTGADRTRERQLKAREEEAADQRWPQGGPEQQLIRETEPDRWRHAPLDRDDDDAPDPNR